MRERAGVGHRDVVLRACTLDRAERDELVEPVDDVVGPGRRFAHGSRASHQHGANAGGRAGLDVAPAVADHEAGARGRRRTARRRRAASRAAACGTRRRRRRRAGTRGPRRARASATSRSLIASTVSPGRRPAGDVGLVGHRSAAEPGGPQARRTPSATPGSSTSSSAVAGGWGRPSTHGRPRSARRRGRGRRPVVPRSEQPGRASSSRAASTRRSAQARAAATAPTRARGCGRCSGARSARRPSSPRSPPLYSNVAPPRRRGPSTSTARLGDLGDRDVVAGRDVVGAERRLGRSVGACSTARDHVADVDVRLALAAVAEDRRARVGSFSRRRTKSKPDAVGLPGPTTLPKRKRARGQAEHVRVRGDERLARELRRAVGGRRDQRAVVLVRPPRRRGRRRRRCPTRRASRRRRRAAHRLDHVVVSAVPWSKSIAGLVIAAAMSGLDARWMTRSWPSIAAVQRLEVARRRRARPSRRGSSAWCGVVPAPARTRVVVERDAPRRRASASRRSVKWLPMKPGAADDETRSLTTASRAATASHLVASACRAGWLTSRCHTTAREPLGVRRDALGVQRRDHDARRRRRARCIRRRGRRSRRRRRPLARELDRPDEVRRHVALDVAAADREHQQRVVGAEPRTLEPGGEDRVPALVVGAGGELGHVVGGRVGLEPAQLAEVVDRVAGVPGRSADAEHEQPPAALADRGETGGDRLDRWSRRARRGSAAVSSRKVSVNVVMRSPPVGRPAPGTPRTC